MTNFSYFVLAAGLHKLFALAFLLGLIFFVVWVLRNVKKDKLKKLSIILLVIGILGCLITMSFGGFGHKKFKGYMDGKGDYYKTHPEIWQCMKDCKSK